MDHCCSCHVMMSTVCLVGHTMDSMNPKGSKVNQFYISYLPAGRFALKKKFCRAFKNAGTEGRGTFLRPRLIFSKREISSLFFICACLVTFAKKSQCHGQAKPVTDLLYF